jgi:hypothetical protein
MRLIPLAFIVTLNAILSTQGVAAGMEACDEQAQEMATSVLVKRRLERELVAAQPSVSACKAWPGKEPFQLAVFVYDTPIRDEKRMLVALLDLDGDKVVASYWTKVDADATTPYRPADLSIDTAPYHLRPGVRAFGIDVATRFSAVQESGSGTERTLYVREGSRIRPVLDRMSMSRWEYIDGYRPYLNTEESPRPETEDFTYTIGIASTSHKGFADLRITRTSNVAAHPPVVEVLRYDGQKYPNPHE